MALTDKLQEMAQICEEQLRKKDRGRSEQRRKDELRVKVGMNEIFILKRHVSPDLRYRRYPRVCLANRRCSHGVPTTDLDTFPGTVFSLDEQCALAFGENYTYIEYVGVNWT